MTMNQEELLFKAVYEEDLEKIKEILNEPYLRLNSYFQIPTLNGEEEKILAKENHSEEEKVSSCSYSLLFLACIKRNKEIVELLLKFENLDVNLRNDYEVKDEDFLTSTPKPFSLLSRSQSKTALEPAASKKIWDRVSEEITLDVQQKAKELTQRLESNSKGLTPLLLSCYLKDLEIVELLVKDERVDVNLPNNLGRTPFFFACLSNDIELVKILLSHSHIDLNQPDQLNQSPFLKLCTRGQFEMIKLLLNDPRLNLEDPKLKTQVLVSTIEKNDQNLFKILYNDSRFTFPEFHPFHHACVTGRIEIIKEILENPNFDINLKCNEMMYFTTANDLEGEMEEVSLTGFMLACNNGQTEVVEFLLSNPLTSSKIDVNEPFSKKRISPLYHSILNNHFEIFQLLLGNAKIDINLSTIEGFTPLYTASQFGLLEFVEELLKRSEIDVNRVTTEGNFALSVSIIFGNTDITQLLLSHPNLDINQRNVKGATALFLSCEFNQLNSIKSILQLEKTDPNIPLFEPKVPPISVAILHKRIEITQELLKHPKIDIFLGTDITPSLLAYLSGHEKIISIFTEYKQRTQHKCPQRLKELPILTELLLTFFQAGREEEILLLFEEVEFNLNSSLQQRFPPLHFACFYGFQKVFTTLLNNPGVNPNLDSQEFTPLMLAIEKDQTNIFQELLQSDKVDPNFQNEKKVSPFLFSLQRKKWNYIEEIMRHPKFDVNQKSLYDNPQFFYLLSSDEPEYLSLFYELLKKPNIDLNLKNDKDASVLSSAIQLKLTSFVSILAGDPRVDINLICANYSPLLLAINENCLDEARELLLHERVDINTSFNGMTPFILACDRGYTNIVKELLLFSNVNLNEETETGGTGFDFACKSQKMEIVKMLLCDLRVNLDHLSKVGGNGLFHCCQNGYIHLVKWILGIGRKIDLNATFRDLTYLEVATKNSHNNIREQLLRYEKDRHFHLFFEKIKLYESDFDVISRSLALNNDIFILT